MKCPRCNGTGDILLDGTIGQRLAFARETLGYSLREVEQKTGISNPLLSQMETGKIKEPSFRNIALLCELYGLPIEDIAGVFGVRKRLL
jgi:transcriptional regulator with XRE-family HTH domain